jgi:hypothetical protein
VMLDVHLNDGRTIMRLESRQHLTGLLVRDADRLEQERCKRAWINRGQGELWQPLRILYLRKATIGWIEQVPIDERDSRPPTRHRPLRHRPPRERTDDMVGEGRRVAAPREHRGARHRARPRRRDRHGRLVVLGAGAARRRPCPRRLPFSGARGLCYGR